MKSTPVISRRDTRRSGRLPRSDFYSNRRKKLLKVSPVLALDAVAMLKEVPIRDCPEGLYWLPRSIRCIFTAFGIRKRASEVDAVKQLNERMTPIKPIMDLLAHGVERLIFFTRGKKVLVTCFWNSGQSTLTFFGSTADFFAA